MQVIQRKTPLKALKDQDKNIFKCPNLSDKELSTFQQINNYFVDNSGFGNSNELALTSEQFLKKVKKGFYYAIINEGQFQVYIGEFIKCKRQKLPGELERKKLANNTYEIIFKNGSKVIRLHQTNIITFLPNGNIKLNSGSWHTHTTKERLNRFSPFRVYQYKYEWYVSKGRFKPLEDLLFFDNMIISPRGKLLNLKDK